MIQQPMHGISMTMPLPPPGPCQPDLVACLAPDLSCGRDYFVCGNGLACPAMCGKVWCCKKLFILMAQGRPGFIPLRIPLYSGPAPCSEGKRWTRART